MRASSVQNSGNELEEFRCWFLGEEGADPVANWRRLREKHIEVEYIETMKIAAKYLGKWENIKDYRDRIEVTADGKDFQIVRITTTAKLFGSKTTVSTYPVEFKSGELCTKRVGFSDERSSFRYLEDGTLAGTWLGPKRPNRETQYFWVAYRRSNDV